MPAPLSNFRAPVVRGGVGRDVSIPWTSRDDALLLLGVYPLTRTLTLTLTLTPTLILTVTLT